MMSKYLYIVSFNCHRARADVILW